MSERYGECRACAGSECFVCGGTGLSGDAISYLESEIKIASEVERRNSREWWTRAEYSNRYRKIEDRFYQNPKKTKALEAAVQAFLKAKNWDISNDVMQNNHDAEIIPFSTIKERGKRMSNLAETKKQMVQTAPPTSVNSHPPTDMSNPFSSLANFEAAQRMAKALSESSLIPKEYQKNIPNCLIALEISQRLRASALMVMQNLYIVHGKPGWSAQYIISAINSCGKFSPLRFKMDEQQQECTAYAIELRTGETLHGTKITMKMANDEGWVQKAGSKWKTMPEQMLRYRAASFFGKIYAPEILMGFQTTEEIEDMQAYSAAKEVKSEVEFIGFTKKDADKVIEAIDVTVTPQHPEGWDADLEGVPPMEHEAQTR